MAFVSVLGIPAAPDLGHFNHLDFLIVYDLYGSDCRPEVSNFFCKELDYKYFKLCGPLGLCCNCSTLPCGAKAATDIVYTNGRGCDLIKLYSHS